MDLRELLRIDPEDQLRNLEVTVESIVGKVLDLNCGSDAKLVQFLRAYGVDAEGIGPDVTIDADYLINQEIKGIKPINGHIPRPDNEYSLVVSYFNPVFVGNDSDALADIFRSHLIDPRMKEEFEQHVKDSKLRATFVVLEGLRVLEHNGQMLCYPSIGDLKNDIRFLADQAGYRIEEKVINHECPDVTAPIQDYLSNPIVEKLRNMKHVTVFTSKFILPDGTYVN